MIRRFTLVRSADPTGISGTGVVAEGVEFTDGTVIIRWRKAATTRPDHVKPTTVVHDGVDSVIALHGHGGATVVEWIDDDPPPAGARRIKTYLPDALLTPEERALRDRIADAFRNLAPDHPVDRVWGRLRGAPTGQGLEGNAWAADVEDIADIALWSINADTSTNAPGGTGNGSTET